MPLSNNHNATTLWNLRLVPWQQKCLASIALRQLVVLGRTHKADSWIFCWWTPMLFEHTYNPRIYVVRISAHQAPLGNCTISLCPLCSLSIPTIPESMWFTSLHIKHPWVVVLSAFVLHALWAYLQSQNLCGSHLCTSSALG